MSEEINDRKEDLDLFPDTVQKDILRQRDLFLIEKLSELKSRKLSYLGLSGIGAYDVIKWRKHLNFATVIERLSSDKETNSNFKTNLLFKLTQYLHQNVDIIFDDIWDYLASPEFTSHKVTPDIVNLDFCGGMINNTNMDYPKQMSAFNNLFQKEANTANDFIMLMTLLPRDKGKTTYKSFLNDRIESLKASYIDATSNKISSILDSSKKFHEKNNLYLFKVCIPLLLYNIGRGHNYSVQLKYCRLYTKMIHFSFLCTFTKGAMSLPPDPRKDIILINKPIQKLLENGKLEEVYPPEFPVNKLPI